MTKARLFQHKVHWLLKLNGNVSKLQGCLSQITAENKSFKISFDILIKAQEKASVQAENEPPSDPHKVAPSSQ